MISVFDIFWIRVATLSLQKVSENADISGVLFLICIAKPGQPYAEDLFKLLKSAMGKIVPCTRKLFPSEK